ncbi:MAG: divalent-cation tolerance protein CutA [Desulfobacteraceae bacterium]|jgi:periplasmic divalent cation tolerance protein|nr:MAG: divalent-cation tolerance protein CutA [Desulfobacteraceae bacterium]
MENKENVVIFITTGTDEEAHRIANMLLNQKKVACVNILPKVRSLFWWQDKLDSAQESLLIVKTRASLLSEIVSMVREVHSYDVPEVIALPIIGGNPDYLEWIGKEVKQSAEG